MDLLEESESLIIFKCNKNNLDLEEFLYTQNVSGRLFRRLYKKKHIYVNGKFLRKNIKLREGDLISLYMEDEIESIAPEKIHLDIVYEDLDLLILNKQPNIVVHPTKSHQTNTLSNGIANYFLEKGINKKIRFVNRLDMDTTGLLIVAKNSFAHQQMAIQFERDTVIKKYLTLVDGAPAAGEYPFPNGKTYIFEAGVVTEIRDTEEGEGNDEEVEELKEEVEELKEELAAVNASFRKQLKAIKAEFSALKNAYNDEPPTPPAGPDADTAGKPKKGFVYNGKKK